MLNRHEPNTGSAVAHNAPQMARISALVMAFALVLVAGLARPAAAQSCVTLSNGAKVCGTADTATIGGKTTLVPSYRGIRYGQAPVGALRWAPPQPFRLGGSVSATQFGTICPQGNPDGKDKNPPPPPVIPAQPQSEDCLFLNVSTPTTATATSALPVMVFIHGGAFVEGSGSSPFYRGGYLAQTGNVVVVTLNYRLGSLGFLAAVTQAGDSIGGNFGLLDQQLALKWVQANISAFGGDPAKVLLFGESAGAMSVGFHLFDVPTSVPLFRAAIMESNPMGVVYRTTAQADSDGTSFIATLCDVMHRKTCNPSAAWLRDSVPADSVLVADAKFSGGLATLGRLHRGGLPEGLPWTPVVDGAFVTGEPIRAYAAGMHPKPYVFGMNRDEGVVFAGLGEQAAGVLLDPLTYGKILNDAFEKPNADSIRAFHTSRTTYPYAATLHARQQPLSSTASALSELLNEGFFDCANLASAQAGAGVDADSSTTQQPLGVYGYYFVRTPVPFNLYGSNTDCTPATGWVCHADELPYVFNTIGFVNPLYGNKAAIQTADTTVANAMGRAWVQFATNPYAAPASGWTAYTAASPALYQWGGSGSSPMTTEVASNANCSTMWSRVPPLGRGYASSSAARATRTRTRAGTRH